MRLLRAAMLIVVVAAVGAAEEAGVVREVIFGEAPAVTTTSVWPSSPDEVGRSSVTPPRRPVAAAPRSPVSARPAAQTALEAPRPSSGATAISSSATQSPLAASRTQAPVAAPAASATPSPALATALRVVTGAPAGATSTTAGAVASSNAPAAIDPSPSQSRSASLREGTLAGNAAVVVPDLIPPPAYDAAPPVTEGAAPTPSLAPEADVSPDPEFMSRREVLGQPSTIVPTMEDPASGAAPASRATTAGWYKILAGACFLGAILLIGSRYQRRPRRADSRRAEPTGGWMPPRREKANRRFEALDEDAALIARGFSGPARGAERNASSWRDEPIARRASNAPSRGRGRAANQSGASGGFVFEALSPTPNRAEPEFHDEIERRVRRLATETVNDDRDRERRPSMRDEEFDLVKELAEDGLGAREIARRLSIPEAEVEAVVRLR